MFPPHPHRGTAEPVPGGLEALRRLSLQRYGLAALDGHQQDPDVQQIAVLAQQLLQAEFA
ncbi:hypothetical protein [Jatrophihabitans lederbergiae]|uniref:Uncharacterized protein n=1 Tax=Jatrophihabitans lederbergiae TaxID=3075547 RepID=A0ABU2JF26_9ACTN|nr:hypothetical protein [Jatrophihabitans sp. DSM 44399]MDT0263289.1 hypothetical protein [Jatrophihabitans sp. DSM 44399]